MRRREFIAGLSGALAWPLGARAQQRPKISRISFLGFDTPLELASRVEALREGLRDSGYVEGKNIAIEFRYAEGKYDRLAALAAELVDLHVDLIVTQGTRSTVAAKQATTTIPIVMTVVGDAVDQGIIVSLARPGSNVTGITFRTGELSAKRLEALKEFVPHVNQTAVLVNPNNRSMGMLLKGMETAAQSLKVTLHPVEVLGPDQFDAAFSTIVERRMESVVAVDDAMMIANVRTIAHLATIYRLPLVGFKELAQAGALLAYGPNRLEMYRRVGYFVDRILKGMRPADLPAEEPTKFEFIINRKTAETLGLEIPVGLLLRADELIE